MQKQLGQLSFADGLVAGATNFLSEVDQVLDFSLLEEELSNTNVKVFNCSPVSQLECFSKVSYEYAISP